ncbi:hypothetical protein [Ferrovibrio terrae]|uniref:hypothetical protein n=1 Tax=Ferrovibrio terrae TaxID=2594003 RepID=UPI00313780CA
MMKRLACLLLLAVAAACSTPTTPPPPRVAVWQGDSTGLLFMRVIATDALRDARLTTPDGQKILAQRISQPEPASSGSGEGWGRPSVGVGGSAGSSGGFGTGIGLSFPIGGGGGRASGQSTQVEFALDPALLAQYRARPGDWLLELNFGSRVSTLAAPPLP